MVALRASCKRLFDGWRPKRPVEVVRAAPRTTSLIDKEPHCQLSKNMFSLLKNSPVQHTLRRQLFTAQRQFKRSLEVCCSRHGNEAVSRCTQGKHASSITFHIGVQEITRAGKVPDPRDSRVIAPGSERSAKGAIDRFDVGS